MIRRLLQGLEQRIGCPRRHSIGFVNEAHLSSADEGVVDELLLQFPDLLNFDLRVRLCET